MKKSLLTLFLFPLLSLLILSCNNPLSRTYNASTYEEDLEAIRQSQKVSEDDIELLTKYIVVSRLAGNDLQGKSYDDILDKIKTIRKATDDENNQIINEKESRRERLQPLLKVKLLEKNFVRSDNKEVITYTVLFQNSSKYNFKMVIGNISLNDLLDKQIKKVDVVLDEELKANSTIKKVFTTDYYPNSENDKRIRSKDLMDIRVEWNPEKIIFENGRVAE